MHNLKDIKALFTFQKENIDRKYIEEWMNKLNIRGEYESTNVRP